MTTRSDKLASNSATRPDFDLIGHDGKSILQPLTQRAFDWIEKNRPAHYATARACGGIVIDPAEMLGIIAELAKTDLTLA